MTDCCACPPVAGSAVCDLPQSTSQRPSLPTGSCPQCGQPGKPVEGQTVKALLSVSLRAVQYAAYLFCRTGDCATVYYTADGTSSFTTKQLRVPVYQKQPDGAGVFVCYCFRHTVGEIQDASHATRMAIVADITSGIQTEQCACDLRNPQGSCCLGNVRTLIKQLEQPGAAVAR
ncbi:MAG: copper chaperone Copz family protein [Herpetosiphon sp.]